MDSDRFDSLVKQLSTLTSRRKGLRAVLAGLAAGSMLLTTRHEAVACRRRGKLCTKDRQCCSGACGNIRKRRFKTKKGKVRKKRVGKCACSSTRQYCKIAKDCCDKRDVCGPNECDDGSVCCKPIGFSCTDDCDCCFDSFCCVECGGICERKECSDTQEACDSVDDCCFEEDDCSSNGCVPGTVCCGREGSPCEDDCDCCSQFDCDEALGECVSAACLEPGEQQCSVVSGEVASEGGNGPLGRGACCEPTVCSAIDCDGQTVTGCCYLFEGDGPCFHDCDCCGDLVCRDEVCIRASCSSSEVACPQDSKEECCSADFPVCCSPDDFEPCCPEGSTCGQFGCIADTPNVCPANADNCDAPPGPLVFCGGPPRSSPLECSCLVDMAGNPVCTTGASCIECTTDADCHAPPTRPNWICIDCPNPTCGHNKGVCAGPCFAP